MALNEKINEGKKEIIVCTGRSCTLFGAKRIISEIERITNVKENTENDEYSLASSRCFGICASAPNIKINEEILTMIRPEHMEHILGHGGCACANEYIDHDLQPPPAEDVLAKNDFLGDL